MQCKMNMKANIQYNALKQKVTVFRAIYFPASSYHVFCFCFVQNNHGCFSVMQSLQYKISCKAVPQRDRKGQTKQ